MRCWPLPAEELEPILGWRIYARERLDERLAQALDRVAAELPELVEEQHPVVRQCSRMSLETSSLSVPTPVPRRRRATRRARP